MELQRIASYTPGADVATFAELQGFVAARRKASGLHEARVRQAARLIAEVASGREDSYMLRQAMQPSHPAAIAHLQENYPGLLELTVRETMSVTDYQALYVDVLDRMYYGYYNAYPIPNRPMVKNHPLRDFRTVKRFMDDGAATPLTKVANGAAIPERAMTDVTPVTYAPDLYAARTSVNWRAMVNADLGIFNDLAQRLAISGNRGIHKFITGLYVDTNGPHASLYTAGFKNQIVVANGAASANPPLSIQGIIDGLTVLFGMKDADGDPIVISGTIYLWHGPALAATAMSLKRAIQQDISVGGGTTNAQGFPSQRLRVENWPMANVEPLMDPYIPIVCTTAGIKNTAWGLMVDPNSQNRPALEFGFLNGFETPQLYQKVPNTMRVGGGVEPTLGDFRTMDQELKVVTVFGGTQIDGRSTVASTGAGV